MDQTQVIETHNKSSPYMYNTHNILMMVKHIIVLGIRGKLKSHELIQTGEERENANKQKTI